jgi:hypothetical protein
MSLCVFRGTSNSEIEEIKWLNYNDLDIISEVDKKIFLNEKGELK